MRTVSLSVAKDRLSALVEEAEQTHEVIHITRHGHDAAVLMSADELESILETLRLAGEPDVMAELAQARAEVAAGRYLTGEQLRAGFLPSGE